MEIFEPIYEVYRRNDKNIIAQGTKDECDKLAKTEWFYSVRPMKIENIIDPIINMDKTKLTEAIKMWEDQTFKVKTNEEYF